jgi:hypothetical protein
MITIIMRGENFVAHLDGLCGTPVAHHWSILYVGNPPLEIGTVSGLPSRPIILNENRSFSSEETS